MNKKEAEAAGYSFTGNFSNNKEEMKTVAKTLREAGNKAMVVNVPPSKYSRSHRGMGYSVYWIESEKNVAIREEKEKGIRKANLIREKERLETEIENMKKRITEIDNAVKEL